MSITTNPAQMDAVEEMEYPAPGPRPPRKIWTGREESEENQPMTAVSAAPQVVSAKPKRKARVAGIDMARGFAVVGMVAVHTIAEDTPSGDQSWAWALFSGKSAPLFALLAGVSLAFITGGRKPHQGLKGHRSRASIVVRACVLFFIGLIVNEYTQPAPENILPYYGLLFLFAIPCTLMRVRHLIIAALGFAIVGPILMYLTVGYVSDEYLSNPSIMEMIESPAGTALTLLVNGTYPTMIWMAFICLGLALGRMKLGKKEVQWGILGAGALLTAFSAVVSDLVMYWLPTYDIIAASTEVRDAHDIDEMLLNYSVFGGLMGHVPTDHPLWLFMNGPHLNTPLSTMFSAGMAMIAVGAISLLAPHVMRLFKPLAVMGTMTLTIYLTHIALLEPLIVQKIVPMTREQLLVLQLVVFAVFAMVWKHFFSQGPLEKVVSVISKRFAESIVPRIETDAARSTRNYNPPMFEPENDRV